MGGSDLPEPPPVLEGRADCRLRPWGLDLPRTRTRPGELRRRDSCCGTAIVPVRPDRRKANNKKCDHVVSSPRGWGELPCRGGPRILRIPEVERRHRSVGLLLTSSSAVSPTPWIPMLIRGTPGADHADPHLP